MTFPRAFIALGANLPFNGMAPVRTLSLAAAALRAAGLVPRAVSGIWETAPWPPSDQPNYFNAVMALDADGLSPQPLYETLRRVETQFGRARRTRWDARTLDLDIVALDGFVGSFGEISLPHPRMHERAFVLAPMAEIAPDWRHPLLGGTVAEMLATLPVDEGYRRIDAEIEPSGGAGG